ncbi:MAG: glycosyltransferase family 4 protein [FCB group bacterium]|nr:glycosyltransferase family 4 protein [FCB group bacterium]
MRKKKVLFIYTSFSSFVKIDYDILSKCYDVSKYQFENSKNLFKMISEQVKLKIYLLLNIWKYDLIYCWFADYHSFLPILFGRIFGKRTFLVLGGYDVIYIPEINYGSFNKPIRAFFAKYSIINASMNLPVSDNLKDDILRRIPNAKLRVLYTGYSPNKFKSEDNLKEKTVLTVGAGNTYQRIKIKGIDFFIEVARKMPRYTFIVVGVNENAIRFLKNIPTNVEVIGKIKQKKLIEYYQKAKVYTQFSMREGLPNAVCESMLCGCIPVGFNNGGIPLAIGDCGFVLDERNVDMAVILIEKAMNSPESLGKKARERIIENFTYELRETKLLDLIKKVSYIE